MITLTREEAQQVLDTLEDIADGAEESHKTKEAIETLRARLAQPEPGPELNKVLVGAIWDSSEIVAPPQREWQGLTDEDIRNIAAQRTDFSRPAYEEYYIAIEQALKDKNT